MHKKLEICNSDMDAIIQASKICKSYSNVPVLKDLDFEVQKGDLVAIMGKSGSGKSTLLHILGSLDRPDSGALNIAGQSPLKLDSNALAEFRNKYIGFVFQFHHLLAEFNLKENISIPGFIKGMSKSEIDQKADQLIDYFRLNANVEKKPAQLSGGEQQRGAICRALFNGPAVVLADEPTGNLDQSNAEEFHRLIRKLSHDFNQTFVIVTHQPDLAQQCDKVYVLEAGKLHLQ